ncbi:phosphomannomutase/phosphoglucomutase [Candidatus Gottesmanbacteria bacterium CG_4_10_14_0_8_um_filter_37_24]|uniref:Phosphomannomutase/phosphoglucomutase n=2 Tax=Candidatus Gottesmaniibacteriota TaxID=1752720 RepID=A0A2M7RSL4_9BACT|nr:MAG: hypothetical protein AUJ73_02515 [Candidatus Gottesmanbacteria bacterium CG1_02_37_22]PIP32158.1 MAG: phosphomannomutase/phosphoglucomutase [Candidatus Gottesmanbacteria bacterium CG23_combo_of_CG06-09_8_20_14_all_37_19]PIZ03075.1 MAG: phosphomannomutase/phosphoglucomutase [Candidatus Gottesmanbacteria bacterium CG_4_10_14_0_8_um_filter_37_24]
MKINIQPGIFRDYDIRGIYPTDINENTFYILGRSIASYTKASEIAVGYDARASSLKLFEALTEGILDQGSNVTNLGLISTEIHYFASGKYHFPCNVIITASHNPAQYNGLKIVTKGVIPLHGSYGLPQIKDLSLKQEFPKVNKKGEIKKLSVIDAWISHALGFVNLSKIKPFKVIVDAGNGVGGISWEKLVGRVPFEIIPLYFEPDGTFPHHLPDPLKKENIRDLQREIIKQHADAGFALDGDADRLFVLDETGTPLTGTVTTAIIAKLLLLKYGPAPVLFNTACGRIVPETITKLGGKPIRVRVGHSFIKEIMKQQKALFAGEHSGHFYFRDNYFAESSLIAGLLILEYLSKFSKPLSRIRDTFDKYPSSGEISFKVKNANKLSKCIGTYYSKAESIDHIDGLSVWFKDWWFNLRASKTEPLLRLNLEADNINLLDEKLKEVKKLIISYNK